jgi:hypothetical protein
MVRQVYRAYLNREPDANGLNTAVAFLQNGGRIEVLTVNIASSLEYTSIA